MKPLGVESRMAASLQQRCRGLFPYLVLPRTEKPDTELKARDPGFLSSRVGFCLANRGARAQQLEIVEYEVISCIYMSHDQVARAVGDVL
jgi:hypothetical protein